MWLIQLWGHTGKRVTASGGVTGLSAPRVTRICRPTYAPQIIKYKGKTKNADRQGCEKKRRQTFSTFCLDFSWIREDGIGGLQRAGWIETSQRAKNARKGA